MIIETGIYSSWKSLGLLINMRDYTAPPELCGLRWKDGISRRRDVVLRWDQWFRVQMRNNWGAFLCGDTCRNHQSDHSHGCEWDRLHSIGFAAIRSPWHVEPSTHFRNHIELYYLNQCYIPKNTIATTVYFMCIHVHICGCTCMCVLKCSQKPKTDRSLPADSPLYVLRQSLPLNAELTDWANLTSQFILRILSFLSVGMGHKWSIMLSKILCGCWGFKLQFSCLHSRWFIYWVISPDQTLPIHNNLSGCHKISETN